MNKLRILLVDEHPVIEEGLDCFFDEYSDIEIVAKAINGLGGLEVLRRTQIDIALLDFSLPDIDGDEAIRLYLEECPEIKIVVYSAHEDEATVYRALKAGAKGYVLKKSPIAELVSALREVNQGGYALSPDLNPAIIRFYLKHRDTGYDELAEYNHLTQRERQVFRLLAEGLQTNEIAETLFISPKTVAKHRVAIKKKLSLDNVAEMAQYAMRIGLLNVQIPDTPDLEAEPK